MGAEEIMLHGIDHLSLRTIAQKCGVTHGVPYKHFGSKERYLKRVLSHLSIIWDEKMSASLPSSTPAPLAKMNQDYGKVLKKLILKPCGVSPVKINQVAGVENMSVRERQKALQSLDSKAKSL